MAQQRSSLEARISKKTTKAIVDFNLIEDGDRIMVGLSGGKDSWALLQTLDNLRKRAPIDFSLIAVNVDSGYKDFKHGVIARTCEERGWEYRIEHTSIGDVMDDILEANATPCSLCARLRRGVLYRIAKEVGATKIALGHHMDDFVETLLLNLFFQGALKAMPARLVSDNGQHVVIRPLVYTTEADARDYAKASELPIIGCCCPACGDLSLQRQRIKRLIAELEVEHPDVKNSMLRALTNVAGRHLLDKRLNPLRPAGASSAHGGCVQESRMRRIVLSALIIGLFVTARADAQQRPLVTEDPETVGSGLVLIEAGIDLQRDMLLPVSGLSGNLLRLPSFGISFGASSIVEIQVDGGLYNRFSVTDRDLFAPLAPLLDFNGDETTSMEDLVIGTKVRLVSEAPGRPAFGVRFATKLPIASVESGLGLGTTDFHTSLLLGK